ncbi:MAG: hypothetical protein AAF610_03385 [Pseudomonadota bacterium]
MRAVIVLVIVGIIGGAAALSYVGVSGESKSVKAAKSTRVGSGGGYIAGGRVK